MDEILQRLKNIKLNNPFPYRDIEKIQNDFRSEFMKLTEEKDSLTSDLNTFCANIAGTLSYIMAGKVADIPQEQIEKLECSFFDWFQQYKFFEDKVDYYSEFKQEYRSFEEARMLLLKYFSQL
jgi:hypothetical protein